MRGTTEAHARADLIVRDGFVVKSQDGEAERHAKVDDYVAADLIYLNGHLIGGKMIESEAVKNIVRDHNNRVDGLLEANNRYQEEARAARADLHREKQHRQMTARGFSDMLDAAKGEIKAARMVIAGILPLAETRAEDIQETAEAILRGAKKAGTKQKTSDVIDSANKAREAVDAAKKLMGRV